MKPIVTITADRGEQSRRHIFVFVSQKFYSRVRPMCMGFIQHFRRGEVRGVAQSFPSYGPILVVPWAFGPMNFSREFLGKRYTLKN